MVHKVRRHFYDVAATLTASVSEWCAAALGSLDTSVQAAACSPSNITDNAG